MSFKRLREAFNLDKQGFSEYFAIKNGDHLTVALAKEVILITGCAGRVGRRVAQKFADPRFMVFGLDTVVPQIATSNFTYIPCDIANPIQVEKAFERLFLASQNQLVSLIHLPNTAQEIAGTEHILQNAQKGKVEQFIFGSTILVYRPCGPGQKIKEHWPLGPTWDYPKAMLQAEEYLQSHHADMPLVLLRQGVGYDEFCHTFLLAREIQKIYEKQSSALFFPGNLNHANSYIHFDDVADAIWLTVQRRYSLPKEMSIIVSGPEVVTYAELKKVIGLLCYGEGVEAWTIPKWAAKLAIGLSEKAPMLFETDLTDWIVDNIDVNYTMDTGFSQEKLGWVPRHSFRQILPKMIANLKENPAAWYRENGLTT